MKFPETIKALDGREPHQTYGGWKNFLKDHCEVRDEHDGVVFFGTVNCNHILFPCGALVRNFGYHGKALMNEIREKGREAVLAKVKAVHAEVEEAVVCLRNGRSYRRLGV